MSDQDLLGLGLAVAGGFLLGKSLKGDDNSEEIKYLKKERRRLMSERDDVIEELEIATQEDYVSPEDRYEEEYEEDDIEVQQRSAMERLARQNPKKYPKHYEFEDESEEFLNGGLRETELMDMMYEHFENIPTVINLLRRNDIDEEIISDKDVFEYLRKLEFKKPKKSPYPKYYEFEDEIYAYRSAELGEQELLDMMYNHFEDISTVIRILRNNDVDEDDLMNEEIMDYLTR